MSTAHAEELFRLKEEHLKQRESAKEATAQEKRQRAASRKRTRISLKDTPAFSDTNNQICATNQIAATIREMAAEERAALVEIAQDGAR